MINTQSTRTIRIAHSPDSDDAFMFYAIKHQKIDLRGYEFEISSDEIDVLNQAAIDSLRHPEHRDQLKASEYPSTVIARTQSEAKGTKQSIPAQTKNKYWIASSGSSSLPRNDGQRDPLSNLDVFAVSFHAYHYLKDQFAMLRSGASMAGSDYGPRLVSKNSTLTNGMKIAVPGKYTSAFLALQIYLRELNPTNTYQFQFCSYNDVFSLLESGSVDASLLIHESQLKFSEQGYKLIVDLGQWWYSSYTNGLRMPLGCNVIRRDLGETVISDIDSLLKESIEWGLKNFEEVLAYSRSFANNDLDDAQAKRYIHMYVDESTIQLTDNDLRSVELLLSKV